MVEASAGEFYSANSWLSFYTNQCVQTEMITHIEVVVANSGKGELEE